MVTVVDGLCVLLVNYNSVADVVRLHAYLSGYWPVLIVDNCSPDRSALLSSGVPQESILSLPHNLGYGAGMNAGLGEASARGFTRCLLLNPDAYPTVDLVRAMLTASERYVAVGVRQTASAEGEDEAIGEYPVAAQVKGVRPEVVPIGDHQEAAIEVDVLTGAAILLQVDPALHVGGFDERYFHYKEEYDLTYRLHRNYGKLLLIADAVMRHRRGGSLDTLSAQAVYYNVRNEVLFVVWNFGRLSLLRLPGLFWAFMRRAFAGPGTYLMPTVRGAIHGFCGRSGRVSASRV